MKLLLDECVARKLKRDLDGHEVVTVVEAGALLRSASGSYDVFITVDKNLPFQQNIRSLKLAVITLSAAGVTYTQLKPLIPQILETLKLIRPGQFIQIETPKT